MKSKNWIQNWILGKRLQIPSYHIKVYKTLNIKVLILQKKFSLTPSQNFLFFLLKIGV